MDDEEVEALADCVAQLGSGERVDFLLGMLSKVESERDQLRDALKEIYFHLGPPQPTLDDPTKVVTLVERAMAERDRLREVVQAYLQIHDEHESIGELVDAGDYVKLRDWGRREHAAFNALRGALRSEATDG